ncbi:S-protein homolog 29-like [Abrus precatorius]|uniref:S-protein homolog n=1 Tax=Abrus precatorius TaxID=3816 RepID=A0A8B8KH95_ABRPR|nr:S-protein homolog 29-like [Abrus precatorius]
MSSVYGNLAKMLKALATVGVLLMIIAADTVIVVVHARKHVRVINDLGNDVFLYLHCRSSDDDLGEHVLEYQQYQEWSFQNNLRGTTLFWCSLQWGYEEHYIEVYNYKKDNKYCGSYCWRSIRTDGAYFYIEPFQHWERRYSWYVKQLQV